MDRRRTVAEGIANRFNIPYATDSVNDLLEQNIDAVYIASPVYLHHEHALAASSRTIHILVEKPLALNSDEGTEIVESCNSSGTFLQVGYMMRFHPLHRCAREILAAGDIGKPVLCRAQLSCWYPPIGDAWRQQRNLGGGGSLIDLGTHCVDLLEWMLGSQVVEVFASTGSLMHNYEVEDSATMLLKFRNGAHGLVDAFFCIPDSSASNVLEIYGTQGSIRGEGTIGQLPGGQMTICHTLTEGGYDALQDKLPDKTRRRELVAAPVDMYLAELEYFSQCVLEGISPATNTGQDGVHLLHIIEAAYKSSSTRQAQRLGKSTV